MMASEITIPNFELIKVIGQGAYGQVWLGRDVNHLHTERYRAIKVVWQGSGEYERSYHREYSGVEQYEPVSREHPALVDVLQVGFQEDQRYFFYVMELADDTIKGPEIEPDSYTPRTLSWELEARGSLPFEECTTITESLAKGLAFLHEKELVHRDIKPSNIISINGQWKFADTGLVTGTGEHKTSVGSLGYLPPEGSGKPASDIFSLGKVIYQIATGMDAQQFPDLPKNFGSLEDAQFRSLNNIYLKACEYNPAERYQRSTEIIDALSVSSMSLDSTVNPIQATGASIQISVLNEGRSEIAGFALETGVHIIGRSGFSNDISIEDKSVSRKHAKLIISDDKVEIEDLKSTYGIFKDGRRVVERTSILPGEEIMIGRHLIKHSCGETTLAPEEQDRRTLGNGRFNYIKKLGQGSFGEVWRMWDLELDENIAAKLLTGNLVDDSSTSDIKREVQKARKLSHDNIIRIFDYCSYPNEPSFMTMEFVDGETLEARRLRCEEQYFTWNDLKPMAAQLCDATNYIHGKGIVHRDIKPTNIMVTHEGQIKLGDFGCARSMIISRYTMGQYAHQGSVDLAGTLIYMSPQMLDGAEPSAADDIYAIGVVLYELLTGHVPFDWRQGQEYLIEQILTQSPTPPGSVFQLKGQKDPIPPQLSSLIMACLSKDPSLRPESAGHVAADFL